MITENQFDMVFDCQQIFKALMNALARPGHIETMAPQIEKLETDHAALLAAGLTDLGVGEHIDLIIIGAIMAQAPGLVITNFMRDIMAGDMMSGLVKLAEALLTGAGIALGTGVALSLVNAVWGVL